MLMLTALSDGDAVWVFFTHPDAPSLGPWIRPDGLNMYHVIADGDIDKLDFVPRFVVTNRGTTFGDLLWTTGGSEKIASDRFVHVLSDAHATGYRTFPVEVQSADGKPVPGYVGFAVKDADTTKDVCFVYGAQSFSFAISDRLAVLLEAAGLTAHVSEPVPADAIPDPSNQGWHGQSTRSRRILGTSWR